MLRPRLLRTGAFRLALLFACLYAACAFGVVWVTDRAVVGYARRTASATLLEESAALAGLDRREGRSALASAIQSRATGSRVSPFHYLLLSPAGDRLAGDLPATTSTAPGWGRVVIRQASEPGEGGEVSVGERYGVRLSDGARLVVGRDMLDVDDLSGFLGGLTLWSALGMALLALMGGLAVGSVFLARLDRVNAALMRIAAGGHTERLPAIGMGAEFDRLADNVNRMLDRILALLSGLRQVSNDIAHDLRTPLTRLRNSLAAAREAADGIGHAATFDDALAQVDAILATFRALLRISAIEAGSGRSRLRPMDLSELLHRVRAAYAPAAEDAGKALVADITPQVRIVGDAEVLTQLFANLVENALRHSGDTATSIRLSLGVEEGVARAAVVDHGVGVPPHELKKVTHRFYTLDPSRADGGAGLGLSLVAAIAALHNARLSLQDARPGLRVEVAFDLANN